MMEKETFFFLLVSRQYLKAAEGLPAEVRRLPCVEVAVHLQLTSETKSLIANATFMRFLLQMLPLVIVQVTLE